MKFSVFYIPLLPACQCYDRATGCHYDEDVDNKGLSIDIHGFYSGGGVCENCGYNSTGTVQGINFGGYLFTEV